MPFNVPMNCTVVSVFLCGSTIIPLYNTEESVIHSPWLSFSFLIQERCWQALCHHEKASYPHEDRSSKTVEAIKC